MQTVAVINQKGGVGKSTTALAVGAGLILRGFKTLFIDLDAQGNLTYTLEATIQDKNVLEVLQAPKTIKERIQCTKHGDIVASSPSLAGADTLITQTGKEYRLREALEVIAGEYDYCIIDTPPALGILTINALTACTGLIIPSQADTYSLQGISQLSSTIEAVRRYCNSALSIMGVVLTRFNGRSIIRREVAEMLERTAEQLHTKLYKARIRECTAIVEAQAMRQSIYEYALKSNAAADYEALVNEILEERSYSSEENV